MALMRKRGFILVIFLGLSAIGVSHSVGQEPSAPRKDEDLEKLLDTLDGDKPVDPPAETKEDAKPGSKDKSNADGSSKSPPKVDPAQGESVSGKDKTLDDLLEKLGETEDRPAPDERKSAPGGPSQDGDKPPDDQATKPDPKALTGKDKATDEHLEELTGKTRKQKQGDDEQSGPLGQVIKEMRDVEQRLGKPDTGEQTRRKQQEIVKNLETLIEQMRTTKGQAKSKKTQKQIAGMKSGQQPGENGEEGGNTGGNPPMAKPKKPEANGRTRLGGKDAWGHLPPELRQEMENVFTEDFLPRKSKLINDYFLNLSKKTVSRNRGE